MKPVLKPPKLAPSAWQLYFTDWIQRQQASGTKLNVAQAAKEAGQEYASLSPQDKEVISISHLLFFFLSFLFLSFLFQPYKRRSQAAKEARERELNAYMRSLTPDDIKRENAYRAAQRKAGKSRKSNIKDPNAPKKPLSAYFMFLQYIRANPGLVHNIFGNETETTKQSVLAAAKWRSMTDAERQVPRFFFYSLSISPLYSHFWPRLNMRKWNTKPQGGFTRTVLLPMAPTSISVFCPIAPLLLLSRWNPLKVTVKASAQMTVIASLSLEYSLEYALFFTTNFFMTLMNLYSLTF